VSYPSLNLKERVFCHYQPVRPDAPLYHLGGEGEGGIDSVIDKVSYWFTN
jgi:hypothetical protein